MAKKTEKQKNRAEAERLAKKVITPQDRRDAGFLAPVLEQDVTIGIQKGLDKGTIDRRKSGKVISSRG